MIYKRFSDLLAAYHDLESGDLFIGQIPASHLKHVIMADLTARGVVLIPSALAQVLNASKVAQALVLQPWMAPHTLAITRRKGLLDALDNYRRQGIEKAVTKEDRLHCGHGVRMWPDLELLYSCLGLDATAFPFVLQPLLGPFVDLRVIWVGDFHEAYCRDHPTNFRKNLAGGGESRPHRLSARQRRFCRQVLERSQMPYAHIDLMLMPNDAIHLSEIRMQGGIHGAQISRPELESMKATRRQALGDSILHGTVATALRREKG